MQAGECRPYCLGTPKRTCFAHVREAVERREADQQARLKIEAEQVSDERRRAAVFNLADVLVIQDDGTARLDLGGADAAHMAAISEIQIGERIVKDKDGPLPQCCGPSRSRCTPS